MAEPTNQQKLDNINHRANWVFEQMTDKIRLAILAYKGTDGRAPKDVYGFIVDGSKAAVTAAQDAVTKLLAQRFRSAYDGKTYSFLDYFLVTNAKVNAADVKLDGIRAALAAIANNDQLAARKALAAVDTVIAAQRSPEEGK